MAFVLSRDGCRRRAAAPSVYVWRAPAATLTRCSEPAADPISEAELSLIWEGQRFPKEALATPAGAPVEVTFPGHRGGAAGPDFRDAVLHVGGEERRGDVELHVRASYFRSHGHHLDPAYDRLALHVVYLADDGDETRLSSGGTTPIAAFAPWVQQRSADIERWLAGPALWREPCADAVERQGGANVRATLASAGHERMTAKVAALQAEIETVGPEDALWRSLVECLGYGGDREGFRRLGRVFPAMLARTLLDTGGKVGLIRSLFAVAGLAPSPAELAGLLPPALKPALAGRAARPANRPERRLEALAGLVARAEGSLATYAAASLAGASNARELVASWQVPALLGPERAVEILLNAILPFCAVRSGLEKRAFELVAALPAQRAYGKTEFLERNLLRDDGKRLARSALEQQGLLGLLSDWCSQGGCGRCPLS